MIQQFSSEGSKLRTCFRRTFLRSPETSFPKHTNVYNSGDSDDLVFYVESGLIKTLALSSSGRQCLLEIYGSGEFFGELCLVGGERFETASVMKAAVLRKLPRESLLRELRSAGLLEEFARYLAMTVARQQQVIADFATVDSEKRLAATLLRLARRLGKTDSRGVRIDERISFEELSEMVGTTRSRIGYFLKTFRALELIQTTPRRSLILKELPLIEYLESEPPKARRKPPARIGQTPQPGIEAVSR